MSEHNPEERQHGPLNPQALRLADMAHILSASSATPITVEMLEDDIANGAPKNLDGTVNLVHYGAWLVKEVSSGN